MLASVKAEQYHRRLISGEGRVRKPLPPSVGPRCCMKMLRLTVLLATLSLGAGCSIDLTCEEPEAYQFAEAGQESDRPGRSGSAGDCARAADSESIAPGPASAGFAVPGLAADLAILRGDGRRFRRLARVNGRSRRQRSKIQFTLRKASEQRLLGQIDRLSIWTPTR